MSSARMLLVFISPIMKVWLRPTHEACNAKGSWKDNDDEEEEEEEEGEEGGGSGLNLRGSKES